MKRCFYPNGAASLNGPVDHVESRGCPTRSAVTRARIRSDMERCTAPITPASPPRSAAGLLISSWRQVRRFGRLWELPAPILKAMRPGDVAVDASASMLAH